LAYDTGLVVRTVSNNLVCRNEYARERCGRHDYGYRGFRFDFEHNHADWDFDN
jgi:hypothetical protein